MNTIIRIYSKNDEFDCLDAFKSNVPDYFTIEEIIEFQNFLQKVEIEDNRIHFYVVVYDEKVIGCGGFGDKNNNEIISLTWGLVHKAYHKMGFGEILLLHRLEQIKKLKPGLPLIVDTTQYSFGFFEKYGFETTKITNDYYTIGMHRYDMVFKS